MIEEFSTPGLVEPIQDEPMKPVLEIPAVVPQRRAAKRAAATLSTQLQTKPRPLSKRTSKADVSRETDAMTEPDDTMEVDHESNSTSRFMSAAADPKKPRVVRTYGKKLEPVARSRRTSAHSASGRPSEYSTLSSPPSPCASSPLSEQGTIQTPKRRKRLSGAMISSASTAKPSSSKRRKVAGRDANAAAPRALGNHIEKMTISPRMSGAPAVLGWARINMSGDSIPSNDSTGFWWPCEVNGSANSDITEITLLGDSPGESSTRTRKIPSTSELTLPFRAAHGIRFDISTFDRNDQESAATIDGLMAEDSQKLRDRWKDAMDQALLKDRTENDGLPDISFLASSQAIVSASQSGGSGHKLRTNSLTPTQEAMPKEQRWKPDPALHIGATGLCREKAVSSKYWPAKIEAHIPQKNDKSGRYLVIFSDGTTRRVPRDWWLTDTCDEFLTCDLGEYEATPEDDEDDGRKSPLPRRDPSPSPLPDVPDDDTFTALDLRLQIAYIRPVLNLIIKGQYRWAFPRHDAFMAGGITRLKLTENAKAGDLSPDDVSDVMKEIRRWALRGERWRLSVEAGDSPHGQPAPRSSLDGYALTEPMQPLLDGWANIPSDRVPRPLGEPKYELLHATERNQYCADVLLPEALLQLYILRRGLRMGPIPNPDDAYEDDLYTSASKVFENETWVGLWAEMVISSRLNKRRLKGLPPTNSKDRSEKQSPVRGTTRSNRIFA
ncbi:hypothetical protein FRB96_009255 [Tulasnella sp. 330]|nr:hypothetical protein FRB96_009255 [Tulasnella sp. 330]